MHQGNWKCSGCGGAITELPFEPRSEAGLTCRTCYAKKKDDEQSTGPAPDEASVASDAPEMADVPTDAGTAEEQPPAPDDVTGVASVSDRPKFGGDWKCAGCGNAITSLPFEPRSTENLKCIDCFKKSKNS